MSVCLSAGLYFSLCFLNMHGTRFFTQIKDLPSGVVKSMGGGGWGGKEAGVSAALSPPGGAGGGGRGEAGEVGRHPRPSGRP